MCHRNSYRLFSHSTLGYMTIRKLLNICVIKQASLNRARILCLLSGLLSMSGAQALLNTLNLSGGLNQSIMNLTLKAGGEEISGREANLNQDHSGTGLGLALSFDVWRWISFELAYNTLGESKVTSGSPIRRSGTINFQGTSAYAVYSYPQRNDGLQFHGKLGLFNLVSDSDLDFVRQENESGIALGGAVSYHTKSGYGGRFDVGIHGESLQIFALSFSRRFNLVTKETVLAQNTRLLNNRSNIRESDLLRRVGNEPLTISSNRSIRGNNSLPDSDSDGVANDKDLCANTPFDLIVDDNGCPLPVQNQGSAFGTSDTTENELLYPDDIIDSVAALQSLEDDELEQVLSGGDGSLDSPFGSQREAIEGVDFEVEQDEASNEEFLNEALRRLEESSAELDEQDTFLEIGQGLISSAESLSDVSSDQDILNNDLSLFSADDPETFTVSTEEAFGFDNDQQLQAFESDLDQLRDDIRNNTLQSNSQNNNVATLGGGLNNNNGGGGQSSINLENILPIQFESGNSSLDNTQRIYLQQLANNLANTQNRIRLMAWRNSNQPSSLNIARQQVFEVRNFLLDNGVSRNQIEFEDEAVNIQLSPSRANQIFIEVIQ